MLRQLLTLLAVISGLGLSAQPAIAARADVVTVLASDDAADCKVVVQRPPILMRAGDESGSQRKPCDRPVIVVAPAPVQLKADRARE
ncbi:hypothetical protein [Aurantiacibacter gangjinensis]|uniref:Uncharacterized protein n=1 Tax=Aurantiacibacter gangjinensis TaxID=502682 RepID=A0A0G9MQM8_9SPHN|nr:hypothetical protein [Aurantiacibacter gangjinensis]APE28911.1 hypothetical protein BMF35_a2082 [Aurantiacibacter gangjinensis]KLE33037.1 hypothetical protein AAW01_03300 [Aurantiacibacter gangjinensis]